jgi:hypothetical protein
MGKTFAAPEVRQPRGVSQDPAFQAAATAFGTAAAAPAAPPVALAPTTPAPPELVAQPAPLATVHEPPAAVAPIEPGPSQQPLDVAEAGIDNGAQGTDGAPVDATAMRSPSALPAPPVAVAPSTSATSPPAGAQAAPARAMATPVLAETKMSIYPGATERRRLAMIKTQYRLAESIVVDYALEVLLRDHTDEEIATVLRGRGHGLRRAKAAPSP